MLPRQEGKTELGVRFLHDLTSRKNHSAALFLAKDSPSRKKMSKEKFDRLFSRDTFNVNTEGVTLKANTQSYIMLGSVDKDPDKNRGGTWAMIHWAEVAFSKLEKGETIPDFWEKVLMKTLSKYDGYALLESTPNGSNSWRDLWDDAERLGFRTLRVSYSQMREMGLISEEKFQAERLSMHPDIFRQEMECEWVTFQGKAYPEMDDDNLWPNMPRPEPWQVIVFGIDWGYNPSATCVLFAYIRDGIIYVFAEMYATHQGPERTRDGIDERQRYWNVPLTQFVGTADHEEDRTQVLLDFGLEVGKADKRSTFGSRMKVKERLYFKTLVIDPVNCPNLMKDLQAAVWDQKKDGEIDYTQCTWGHFDAEAALRYLIEECTGNERLKPIKNPHEGDTNSTAAWRDIKRLERDQG